MEKNVGGTDRTVRLVVGAVLLFTGVTQMCILNRLFGIDTFRG